MAVKKQKTFTVQFNLNVVTGVNLKAESMEETLAKAKEYGVRDVVDFDGDYIDGEIEVTAVFC